MDSCRRPCPEPLLDALLALPAAERLELADILRRSVGCPGNADALDVPGWQRAREARLLRQGEPASAPTGKPQAKKSPTEVGLLGGTCASRQPGG